MRMKSNFSDTVCLKGREGSDKTELNGYLSKLLTIMIPRIFLQIKKDISLVTAFV